MRYCASKGDVKMGVIYARIDEQLEKKFRVKVVEKYGGQRRALSKAVEEALQLWLNRESS